MIVSSKLTARYAEWKREAPGCILLMQVGAFMHVINEDAQTLAEITGLKLQMAGAVLDPSSRPGSLVCARHGPSPQAAVSLFLRKPRATRSRAE